MQMITAFSFAEPHCNFVPEMHVMIKGRRHAECCRNCADKGLKCKIAVLCLFQQPVYFIFQFQFFPL